MGGKAPSISVPPVAATPTAAVDNSPSIANNAAGQDNDPVKKQKDKMAARAAAAQTILTGPGGLDNATAIVGKQKLGS